MFILFIIHLDPYLRKVIKEERPSFWAMQTGGNGVEIVPFLVPRSSAPPHGGSTHSEQLAVYHRRKVSYGINIACIGTLQAMIWSRLNVYISIGIEWKPISSSLSRDREAVTLQAGVRLSLVRNDSTSRRTCPAARRPTLTLLFATHGCESSPFLVLEEIDAALHTFQINKQVVM